MKYDYILFDLDGTITDPGIGITNSVMYALKKFGIEVKDRCELYKFIGPPLWESFERFYGFSKAEANQAVQYYREYFSIKGLFENSVIDGFEELFIKLKQNNQTIILATSKPEVYAKQILEHFDLEKYFTFLCGSNLDGTRIAKYEVITHVLECCNIKDLSKAVMVGDREHDIIGAKKAGIDSIGVLFGYGDREEHENAGADYIAETVEDLEKILFAEG